ncbi:MAG: DNA alkylation repair protein [Patescibacteria group bacterium]|jgi:3-methyladenine DNA glycosylase AlkD
MNKVKKELKKYVDLEKAKILQRFFKTGKGEYGAGDVFIGVTVPNIRKVAKKFQTMQLKEVELLLHSKIHEERLCAALILVEKFEQGSEAEKQKIYKLYLKNAKHINNWDLVDLSAPKITGAYLLEKNRDVLYKLAHSKNLWKKRIAILSTYAFIRENQFKDTLEISKILLNDKHDLMHKAVGWMLREVGNRDREVEEKFLKKYYKKMPRTMLRYTIEKFPEELRQEYLKSSKF